MKVSLITLHYIVNYGSVLQTYASQKKFESLGFDTEVVDYVRENLRDKDGNIQVSKKPIDRLVTFVEKKIIIEPKIRCLKSFLEKNINFSREYNDYEELKEFPPSADIYCTGSDQMWNSEYNGGILPEYFLEYAPEGKTRVAYSTSFGRTDLSDTEINKTSSLVKKYRRISVREASAIGLLEKMGVQDSVNILDPTLVLDREQWNSVIAKRKVKSPYVFLYQLNINHDMELFAKRLAKEKHCKLIIFTSSLRAIFSYGKKKYAPSVDEFLSLINYAEFVVTDSFHGTAFSLNFNKQLFVFYPPLYKTRLESVLKLLGQECRAINDGNTEIDSIPPIDYGVVNIILEKEREKATRFIVENFK